MKNQCPRCSGLKDTRAAKCRACEDRAGTTKWCSKCSKELPIHAFGIRTKAIPKPRSVCRECERIESKKYMANLDPARRKAYRLREKPENLAMQYLRAFCKRNGIHVSEVPLIKEQIDTVKVCAICGNSSNGKGRFQIDHDHITGKFRGLLCVNCNIGIGQFKDNPQLLAKAIEYLTSHRP